MTTRLLAAYGEYPINAIVTLDAGTEAGLVAAKLASSDTSGGTPYVPPVPARQRRPVEAEFDPVTGGIELSAGGESVLSTDRLRQSAGYHFHGFAGTQGNRDGKFYDYSGALNDGAFGANLALSMAWGAPGLLTQPNPTDAGQDTLIQIPSLNFDYLAGESLLIFWKGQLTPEAGDTVFMGDTTGSSANGLRLIASSTGKLKVNGYQASGPQARFGGTSSGACFVAGETHSFGLAIDGVTGKHKMWVDGAVDAAFVSGFLGFGSGGVIDTKTVATLKVGGDGSTTSSIQNGPAMAHQALVILRGRLGLGVPANIDALVANLHRNPSQLVTAEAW